MKRLITVFLLIGNLACPVYAGEIIIKVPSDKLDNFVRVLGVINRVFSQEVPKALDKEKLTLLANRILPLVSCGRMKGLSDIPAEIFVMKDEVIVQVPDVALRKNLDEAYAWCHVTQAATEQSRINGVSNAILTVASLGAYRELSYVPAEIEVRFDDKQYERYP